jgi:hypothetical protein
LIALARSSRAAIASASVRATGKQAGVTFVDKGVGGPGSPAQANATREKMKHTNCRPGNVSGDNSFPVINHEDKRLFWMTYDTEAKAKAAHELLTAALKGAGVVFADPVK